MFVLGAGRTAGGGEDVERREQKAVLEEKRGEGSRQVSDVVPGSLAQLAPTPPTPDSTDASLLSFKRDSHFHWRPKVCESLAPFVTNSCPAFSECRGNSFRLSAASWLRAAALAAANGGAFSTLAEL